MSYHLVDGTALYVEQHGSGPPLVFLHGLGSSGRDWAPQVAAFAADFRVLTIDLRGHGRSGVPPGPYTIPQMARDVAVVLRKLDATPATVVGLSMGGMVALQLAADAPDLVQRLCVVNSMDDMRLHTWYDVWFYLSRRVAVRVLGMRRVAERLARVLFVRDSQAHLRDEMVRRWSANNTRGYLAAMDAIMGWHITDRLPAITAPTLLVAATHDYTPVAAKRRTAAALPNARVVVIPNARHALPVERPEAFNATLRTFLDAATP
ncbi:alpha/beta fold hydrolase [Salisaeta longa]|uniref:alpha/beta fold hydrolase n=1 Tax=Salisaeta longa TaxID=503170 RepID=UPI0003B6B554|nr:alpha/beta fold hydrolase [Salisaeta longa]